jgi:ribonucleoside-diphosphate reductase alpha chain
VADAVLAGGIRRAALISLFSADDDEMLSAKSGLWWETSPQRGRANNSAVLLRHRITKDYFLNLWSRVRASGAGEPGFYFSNDKDWGTNPCCEIGLRPYQFCNLTEVNVSNIKDQADLETRVRAAAFLGTLQAGYTDFHYLRPVWQRNTEKEALIGVSMTGIASGAVLDETISLSSAAKVVKAENRRVAAIIGINPAARTTCVKPAGTTSLTLGTSSGIHAWYDQYYIRRIRVGKTEAIYEYLLKAAPNMVEDDYFRPHDTAVIAVPQAAPDNSILRTESALSLLRRIKKITTEWVNPGHVKGQNTHNVSATISVRPSEWDDVGEWMWDNRHVYNGLSVLPYSDSEHTYVQAPFEECSKETYEALYSSLVALDLAEIREESDDTDLQGELACAGGMCEIK